MNTETKMTGEITAILPTEEISSGKYKKQVFAIKNNSGFEGREAVFAFEIFEAADKDKIEKFLKFNKVGDNVDVSYEIRCNEFNNKYFTSLSAWKVFKADGKAGIDEPIADEVLGESPPF